MITRVSGVIRPKGSDLIFDHPYNAEYAPHVDAEFASAERYRMAIYARTGLSDLIQSGRSAARSGR
jgi:hypothetical protein